MRGMSLGGLWFVSRDRVSRLCWVDSSGRQALSLRKAGCGSTRDRFARSVPPTNSGSAIHEPSPSKRVKITGLMGIYAGSDAPRVAGA